MVNPVKLKPNPNTPSIQQVQGNIPALTAIAQTLRQIVQSLSGQSGSITNRAVTFDDLVGLDMITVKNGLASAVESAESSSTTTSTGGSFDLEIGTTTTLSPGSSAEVSLTSSGDTYTLDFGIPRGSTGTAGPAITLDIGTVTTLSAGASATASLASSGSTYTLSLGIPQGEPGSGGFIPGPYVGMNAFTRPALSALTIVNNPSATTFTDVSSGPIAIQTSQMGADLVMLGKSITTSSWSLIAMIEPQLYDVNYNAFGLFVNDTTGKLINFLAYQSVDTSGAIIVQIWSNPTNYSSTIVTINRNVPGPLWFKMVSDGSTLTCSVSSNGILYDLIGSTSISSNLGTIAYAGVVMDPQGTPNTATMYVWDFQ